MLSSLTDNRMLNTMCNLLPAMAQKTTLWVRTNGPLLARVKYGFWCFLEKVASWSKLKIVKEGGKAGPYIWLRQALSLFFSFLFFFWSHVLHTHNIDQDIWVCITICRNLQNKVCDGVVSRSEPAVSTCWGAYDNPNRGIRNINSMFPQEHFSSIATFGHSNT